jgi:hypothetical protein
MANSITPYQEIVMIKLKDGKYLRTTATMEQVSQILNDKTKDYIMIDGVGFNRLTAVEDYYPYNPDELECFIRSQPKEIQEELEKIVKTRKEKQLPIR